MNLASLIEAHPGDAPALCNETGHVTTYAELRRAVGSLRARLTAAGVAPGDRIAILSVNHPAFVVAYLAILGVGAVAVPLNPASPPAELSRELGRVRAKSVVTGPAVASGPGSAGGVGDLVVFDADSGPEEAPPIVDREAGDLAVLIFTAGTGGAPRPAMLTHGNLLANLDQVQRHPDRAISASDVCFGVLPLFHIFGLNVVLGGSLLVGASVLLLDRFDPETALELIDNSGVTLLLGAPTMYAALAALPPETAGRQVGQNGPRRLSSVRLAFSGAAPLPAEVADACERRFGLVIRQGYGLTEASPVVTSSIVSEPPRPGSIGVPLPGVEVRLVDDEGEEALAGDPGEIWVRGPNVFPGYWEDDEATAGVLTDDGWLRTGDIAVAGDDGELYIVDRAKDLIIVSGFNVFPAEVEEALLEHPAVSEVAVVGDGDAYRGEVVHAYVVLAEGSGPPPPTAEELIAFCGERLARYKCPAEVSFVPSLPHGLGGKLLRRALRSAPG